MTLIQNRLLYLNYSCIFMEVVDVNFYCYIFLLFLVLDRVKSFEIPFLDNKMKFDDENGRVMHLDFLLTNLSNNAHNAFDVADKAEALEEQVEKIPLQVCKRNQLLRIITRCLGCYD